MAKGSISSWVRMVLDSGEFYVNVHLDPAGKTICSPPMMTRTFARKYEHAVPGKRSRAIGRLHVKMKPKPEIAHGAQRTEASH